MHLQDIIPHSIACCLMSVAEAVYAGLKRLICFLELLSGCIEELCVFLELFIFHIHKCTSYI